jgi:hypothetical protein
MSKKGTPSTAYEEAKASQRALARPLFELMVKDSWLGTLQFALEKHTLHFTTEDQYLEIPVFSFYVGQWRIPVSFDPGELEEMLKLAKRFTGKKVDEDKLQELIEEVLADEFEKYHIVLKWRTFHWWDGTDRRLTIVCTTDGDPYEDLNRS